MRAILSGLGLLIATSAFAGDLLVIEPARPTQPAAPAAAATVTATVQHDAAPAAPKPYPAIDTAPLFGRPGTPGALRVDETALRFYAQQKNYGRVDAEIKRLKTFYPTWKPPANPYAAGGDGDGEQALWDLLGAGRLDDLARAIKTRQQREPGWLPSDQLGEKLRRQQAVASIVALSDAGNWSGVLDIANRTPDALSCATIDTDWRVAEAFSRTGIAARTFGIDQAILSSCKNRDERVATVRKALSLLSSDALDQLIAMGEQNPDGTGEFDGLRLDMARTLVGQVLAGTTTADIPTASIDALTTEALRSGASADAGLLGWYFLSRKNFEQADTWFKLGIGETQGDAKLTEGRVAALRGLRRIDEAGQLARAWRDSSPALRSSYVDLTTERLAARPSLVDAAVVADFEQFVTRAQDAAGAASLGWVRYGRQDWAGATMWFRHALDWAPAARFDAAAVDKVTEGYALALRSDGRAAEALDVVLARPTPALQAVAGDMMADALTAPGATVDAALLTHIERIAEKSHAPRGAAALGWYHLQSKELTEAAVWFKAAIDWRSDGMAPDAKTLEGYVLALRGADRPDEAVAVVEAWRDRVPAVRPLLLDALVDSLGRPGSALAPDDVAEAVRLVEADPTPHRASALGWHYFAANDLPRAEQWFKSAITRAGDGEPDPKAIEGLSLTLRAAGRADDALVFAEAWSQRLPALRPATVNLAADALVAAKQTAPLDPAVLGRLDAMGAEVKSAPYAAARAWYGSTRHDWRTAADWFGHAVDWSGKTDAKTAEGYALSLRNLCRYDEAKAVATPWLDAADAPLVRAAYIGAAAEQIARLDLHYTPDRPETLRFAGAVVANASADGAQALGWYAYRTGQYRSAIAWFDKAMTWGPSEATAFGLAISARKAGDREAAARVVTQFVGSYPVLDAFRSASFRETDPRFARFFATAHALATCPQDPSAVAATGASQAATPASAPPGVPAPPVAMTGDEPAAPVPPKPPRAMPAPHHGAPPSGRVAVVAPGEQRSAAEETGTCGLHGAGAADWRARGWCLFNAKRPAEAAIAFRRGETGTPGGDGAFGEALSLLGSGDVDGASAIAAHSSMPAAQQHQIDAELLRRQASTAFEAKHFTDTITLLDRRDRIATEARDQIAMRGWAHYQLGDYEQARAIFERMDQMLSDTDSRHALAVVGDALGPRVR